MLLITKNNGVSNKRTKTIVNGNYFGDISSALFATGGITAAIATSGVSGCNICCRDNNSGLHET